MTPCRRRVLFNTAILLSSSSISFLTKMLNKTAIPRHKYSSSHYPGVTIVTISRVCLSPFAYFVYSSFSFCFETVLAGTHYVDLVSLELAVIFAPSVLGL